MSAEDCLTCGAPLSGPPSSDTRPAYKCLAPQQHAQSAPAYGCWVTGCASVADYVLRNPEVPLVRPVESCRNHLGDLLGNAAKSALGALGAREVTLQVTRLV